MIEQIKELDFSGQRIWVGIDVHLKNWRVSIMVGDLYQKGFTQPADVQRLINYLHKHYPKGDYVCCYEAGFSGFWAYEELMKAGIACKVAHASDIPTTDKEKRQKTDPRDSRKIVRELSKGGIEGIYIPHQEALQARSLVRTRYKIAKDSQRAKNRIKSHLYFYGYHRGIPAELGYWSKRYINYLSELASNKQDKGLVLLIEELNQLRQLQLRAIKQLRQLSRCAPYQELVELLKSVPGVGLLTAMVILTELIDINRFKKLDHLCSYAGLIPQTSSSGESQRVGSMTKRGNTQLKKALIESAWVAIQRDPALALAYQKSKNRYASNDSQAKNKAIVKIARKLLNRIRFVWQNRQEYEIGKP